MYLIPLKAAYVIAAIAALMMSLCVAAPLFRILARAWEMSRGNMFARYVFLLGAAGAVLYGGSKGTGTITYPYTDPEVRYLVDAGSYVTNDAIRVAFTTLLVPTSAPLLIDRRQLDQTNDVDWVNFTNTTIAAFNQPQTIAVPAATNYNWIVYTTWTPGPTVQTNGVWHAYWGLDRKAGRYLIPVRTCVRDGATVIATPKSRWDAANTNATTEAAE